MTSQGPSTALPGTLAPFKAHFCVVSVGVYEQPSVNEATPRHLDECQQQKHNRPIIQWLLRCRLREGEKLEMLGSGHTVFKWEMV